MIINAKKPLGSYGCKSPSTAVATVCSMNSQWSWKQRFEWNWYKRDIPEVPNSRIQYVYEMFICSKGHLEPCQTSVMKILSDIVNEKASTRDVL